MEPHKEGSLLIIDDEEPIRRLLSTYLSDRFTCLTAASAEEARVLLTGTSFDLVITDIMMPGTSGIDLCHYVQQTCP